MSAPARRRIAIISHDIVGSRMAGTGIRYWELARVLATAHDVTLLAPQPIDLTPPDFGCGHYRWGDQASLEAWLDTDLVVANGFVLLEHDHLAHIAQPLALDLYDPVLLENLELWRHRPNEERVRQNMHDQRSLARQLRAGDFFMCATERQRDLLIGALMGAGRITHAATDHDPALRHLIDVVPFGLPADPPVRQAPALRGVLPGIGADDKLLLWTGGLWDWMDPQTLVQAMPAVVAGHSDVRLVFLAGQHPGMIEPMRAPEEARRLAAEHGLLETHIFFHDQWVPYERRADFLLDADIAVSLHHNHLETAYAAVRSRFLDHLWAGLPSVVADGDAAAALVRATSLGLVVQSGDVQATADALHALLSDDALRARCAAAARATAKVCTWKHVAAPLLGWCAAPRRTRPTVEPKPQGAAIEPVPQPSAPGETPQGANTPMQHEREQLIKQLEASWQFGTTEGTGRLDRAVEAAVGRVLGPMIARQREFNASLVRLLYTLPNAQDTEVVLNAVMEQVAALEREIHVLRGDTFAHVESLNAHTHARIDAVGSFTGELSARLDTLERDLHGRLDTLADVGGELNDRLTRLAYATQLLDQAVVAGDALDMTLAEQIAALAPTPRRDATSTPTPPSDAEVPR
jgi:glycosyltransferase involved in cell wall biosynthesis